MADSSSTNSVAAGSSLASTASPVQATSASSFVNSIGVNAHIDSGVSIWENTQVVAAELAALGIKHVRDGTPYDWALQEYVALAKTGVTFDLSQENPIAAPMTTIGAAEDVQRADTLAKAVPGSVESLEGANEYNISSYNLNGSNSYGNVPWGAVDDANLQAAVTADPILAGVKVVAASTALLGSAPVVSSYVDASNWHVYAGVGEQLGANLAAGIAAAKATAPGKPVYVTEAGVSSSGYGSSNWGVADQATQGLIDTNALLDSYKDGAARTFLYDLMDDTNNTPQENHFGLFNADGTAKPAATDIGNLVSLLSDKGTATPGTLSYSLSGLPGTASSMLLQKSDGTFDIVIWNGGATLYNGTADVTPPTAAVTVTFGGVQQRVSVYDPITGRAALQSVANAGSVTFGLSADPVIVEVAPPAAVAPVTPAPIAAPAPVIPAASAPIVPSLPATPPATGSLVLHLSEDAWQGDAQFTVSVDGVQVGAAQAVTALHSQGKSEAFSFAGSFGAGPHQVGVSFINDAYGGTSTTDRNLYVDSISLNGAANPGATATMDSSGTQNFSVAGPASAAAATTGSDTLVLHLSEDAWLGDAQFTASVDGVSLGAAQAVTALHGQGGDQAFSFSGSFGAGPHQVAVSFINDAYGGTSTTDRNLYVDSISLNGAASPNTSAALLSSGTKTFAVAGPAAAAAATVPINTDTLVLHLSEDAWQGDAQFVASVDGAQLGAAQAMTALHGQGGDETFTFTGHFGAGAHDLAVTFLNDAYGGTSATDRNLYVNSADLNGTHQASVTGVLYSSGTTHFQVVTPSA